ncbi:Uncharacterised protein [Anaerococcus octavius]|uniref:Uncharacterized protein n=1 Tax=Anaerococcus octavius TaxID=54007 RepID=A0A380WYW1_9FIRM|nr:Uncharacterised protein [Anaerococcus octavius]
MKNFKTQEEYISYIKENDHKRSSLSEEKYK